MTYDVTFRPVPKEDYAYLYCRDATSRLKMERELEDERASLIYSSKMATLGEMAGGVAHEINNPLAIIQGYSARLKKLLARGEMDKGKMDHIAEKIQLMTVRIARIVKGLRNFSRDSSGEAFRVTKVSHLLDDTLELCRERFYSRGIKLILGEVPEDLLIECQPVQITQVILNLLNNGHDAVESLDDKWVSLDILDRGEFIEFSITDSGNGISSNIREKIFQPFYTTKPVGKGTGLGLSISKGIIESHGGEFRVDTSAQNTRFVFTLLRKQTPLQSDKLGNDNSMEV